MKRTKCCGAFCKADVGAEVTAMGWVQTKRDMGGVIFLDPVRGADTALFSLG